MYAAWKDTHLCTSRLGEAIRPTGMNLYEPPPRAGIKPSRTCTEFRGARDDRRGEEIMSDETKAMWLGGGQYHCDEHRPVACIPFFFAPFDAECAECSDDAPSSYLSLNAANRGHNEDQALKEHTR